MELWDLYSASRELLGRTHVRGDPMPEGCFHLVVHVWLRNSRGQYLMSQRSASRPTDPLLWECTGGSVVAGEDSLAGALREAREELGIALRPEQGRLVSSQPCRVVNGVRFMDILDVWLFDYEGEACLDRADGEVAQARWMGREEIAALMATGKLVNSLQYFFDWPCDP